MAARPVVGLDIGTSGVRAAQLGTGKAGLSLDRYGHVGLPPGAVHDGEVVDVAAVAAALRQLWAQGGFSSRRVVVGVANQRVVVRQVELPWLPPAELRAALPFQVQDVLPMPVEQAILDHYLLEESVSDTGERTLRILLVAAAREMVVKTLDAVQQAGLRPTGVDLTSFAVLRSAAGAEPGYRTARAEALVDIGARVTNIVVHEAGVPRFVRILLMGGADFTDAVAERMGVPLEHAEQVKRSSALSLEPGEPEPTASSRALEQVGTSFVEELRGTLDFYGAQPHAVRVRRIVVSGGGSQLGGLLPRLAAGTRLPVEPAQPASRLHSGPTGLDDDQLAAVAPLLAVPVGLALGAAS